jgi:hypothetical protein
MIISLVAVGEEYTNKLDFAIESFKSHKISLLSDLVRDDVFYCQKYENKKFSYFDKLYFSLDLVDKFKEDVFYLDVTKINEVDLSFPKNQLFYYKSHWPYGDIFENYLQYNFFEPIINYWEEKNVDYKSLPVIRETELFFSKEIDSKLIIKKLKDIQPIFRNMSLRQQNYPGYDNAEGLALSYVLKLLNII